MSTASNHINYAEQHLMRDTVRERLIQAINPPRQDPTFRDVEEMQRWNPAAMSAERLAEFQKAGWFKDHVFDQKEYEQHQKELYAAADRTYPEVELTPEEKAKDLERRKMITQVVGAEWKYEDESLDQYKLRSYGIPIPIQDSIEGTTGNVQKAEQPRQPQRRKNRKQRTHRP